MSITLGQAHETEITLEKAGATSEFWARLAQNVELAKAVVQLVMNAAFRLVAKIDRDMEGWTCVEPAPAEEGDFEPFLQEFLQKREDYITGKEMISRAENKTGLRHAEAMLRNQEKIPVEWRKFYLVFPEVWLSPGGSRGVWCLCFGGGRWCLHYYWLGDGFGSLARLVSSRKYQK